MIVRILGTLIAAAAVCFGQLPDSAGATQAKGRQAVEKTSGAFGLASLLPDQLNGKDKDFQSLPSVFFALDVGQAVKGVWDHALIPGFTAPYTTMDHVWQEHMLLYLSEKLTYKERLSLTISVECDLNFSMIQNNQFPQTLVPNFNFYPNDIALRYKWGDLEKPWLQIAAGYFPYKYNLDSKNLGEFLLRSNAYPNTIVSNFEFAMTRELGLIASASTQGFLNPSIDKLSLDFLLTSETHSWPIQDGTISAVVSNTAFNFLTIGGGMSWQRLFPVDESKEKPLTSPNTFLNDTGGVSHYTFQSTKAVGFASIAPMGIIPQFRIPPSVVFGKNPFFGKQDLKVYAEVGVLGLDNYVAWDSIPDTLGINHWQPKPDSINYYNNIKDRMPVILGVNLPTHPLLSYGVLPFILTKWLYDETGSDIRQLAWVTLVPALASGVAQEFLGWDLSLDDFSLEFEWFSQRFPNSNRNVLDFQSAQNRPIPYTNAERYESAFGKPEPVKYSLHFSKSFMDKRFAISGIVARDHMRPLIFTDASNIQTDDFLQSKDHWWWVLRLSANF
jgi:hypothetical protein